MNYLSTVANHCNDRMAVASSVEFECMMIEAGRSEEK